MVSLHELLKEMIEKGASDLHITTGSAPQLRIESIDRVSDRVREKLRESAAEVKANELVVAEATTASPEAWHAYFEGLKAEGRSESNQAIAHYREAFDLRVRAGTIFGYPDHPPRALGRPRVVVQPGRVSGLPLAEGRRPAPAGRA